MDVIKLRDTVQIASCYLPALVNGDSTGLDDSEAEYLDHWEAALVAEAGKAITFNVTDPEPGFCRDAITGLMADCVEVELWA